MIKRVLRHLNLKPSDNLLDLCCGNGLLTYELSQHVKSVTGVDFSSHLIKTACEYKKANNIKYVACDILVDPMDYIDKAFIPNKILMNAALAYFDPNQFYYLLSKIKFITNNNFSAFFTDVPIEKHLLKFYNTPERLARYHMNKTLGRSDNDGLGRWWSEDEIADVVSKLHLRFQLIYQPAILSNYRIDVLISTNE